MKLSKRWVVVSLALVSAACGTEESDDPAAYAEQAEDVLDLTPETGEAEIVGGATYYGLPGVGALITLPTNGNPGAICTGTLIDQWTVLTAAHCVDHATPASLVFKIGVDARNPQKTYDVWGIRVHPGWSRQHGNHDIAKVILNHAANEPPAMLLSSLQDIGGVGAPLLFVGYGATNGSGAGTGTKRAVTIPITGITPTYFTYQRPGASTCSGDSGGPAFFIDWRGRFLLAGVTSYGQSGCTGYGVDTNVSAYLGWLGKPGYPPAPIRVR